MKIQRTNVILVLVALGLAGGIYWQQRWAPGGSDRAPNPTGAGTTAAKGPKTLFPFQEQDVVRFTLRRPDLTLTLEKQPSSSPGEPDWRILAPTQLPANEPPGSNGASDGAVAYLLSLLATGEVSDRFALEGDREARLAEFGLDRPMAQLDLTLADGSSHKLILGAANFDRTSLYAIRDGETRDPAVEIVVVDIDLEPAVQRPLAEWLARAELPEPQFSDGSSDRPSTENNGGTPSATTGPQW